jgi:Pyruvate/2-oxoacid:ferredoxin oxidoreductase gamma subunit
MSHILKTFRLTVCRRIYRDIKTIDATKLAADAGNPQAMNVVMLGVLSKYIPLREEELIEALSEVCACEVPGG